MDYNSLCKDILKINSKVRYAGVYSVENGQIYDKTQDGITRFLDKEQTHNSLIHAYMRWKTRQHHATIIGEPIYAMAKYAKVNRITIPASKSSLLMISTETDLEPHEIMDDVMNLIVKYSDDPDYVPHRPSFHF